MSEQVKNIVLEFDPAESIAITTCARIDNCASPSAWALDLLRSLVTETIDEGYKSNRAKAKSGFIPSREDSSVHAYEKRALRSTLQISPDLFTAFTIIASWEGMSFCEACRMVLTSFLESGYGELLTVKDQGTSRERAWAVHHHAHLAALMEKLGWDGSTIASGRDSA